jgi:hypothetical protein
MMVTVSSKNLKEAQGYLGFGMIVPLFIAGAGFFNDLGERLAYVPLISDPVRIGAALTGESFALADAGTAAVFHGILAAMFLAAAAFQLRQAGHS